MKEFITSILKAPEFWAVFVPFIVAVGLFFLTERKKLIWEQFKRKEESYSRLLKYLRGFYVTSASKEDKDKFLGELNQCWLYAPDDIIEKAYNFLDSVHKGQVFSDKAKEKRFGELVAAIRMDILRRKKLKQTRLKAKDFRHLRAT